MLVKSWTVRKHGCHADSFRPYYVTQKMVYLTARGKSNHRSTTLTTKIKFTSIYKKIDNKFIPFKLLCINTKTKPLPTKLSYSTAAP